MSSNTQPLKWNIWMQVEHFRAVQIRSTYIRLLEKHLLFVTQPAKIVAKTFENRPLKLSGNPIDIPESVRYRLRLCFDKSPISHYKRSFAGIGLVN